MKFDNEVSGKSRTIRIPNPREGIADLTAALKTHMDTYVAPVMVNTLTFSDASVEDKTVTILLADQN